MLTPDEVYKKLLRHYTKVLSAWVRGENMFPLALSVGTSPSDLPTLLAAAKRLHEGARNGSYHVQSEENISRRWGKQTVPRAVVVETLQEYLRAVGKGGEFNHFTDDVSLIRARLPQLEIWLSAQPQRVIDYAGKWQSLIDVCTFVLAHPDIIQRRSLRELPIPVHTKFIETHQRILAELLELLIPTDAGSSEPAERSRAPMRLSDRLGVREEAPPVRMRFLDDQLARRCGIAWTDVTLPAPDWNALNLSGERGLIIENKATFLTLPNLPNTFAVWGQGFAVDALAAIAWLPRCSLIYWGDLDAQGFQILARLRSVLPGATVLSALMDQVTYETFAHFSVPGTPLTPAPLLGLTPEEHTLFMTLAHRNLRLEQERIPMEYALSQLTQ